MQIRDAPGERIIKRDRLVVVSGLVGMVAFSWASTVYLAWDMQHLETALCGTSQLLMFTMWTIMMAAMMVPSAAPMILIFAEINRKRREQERPFVPTGVFLLGNLVVWTGFSAVVTVLQWRLHETAPAYADDGECQSSFEWRDASGSRCVSIDTAEARLLTALPVACGLSAHQLAR